MAILLYSENEHGQAAFQPALIAGYEAAPRRYHLHHHFLLVDGGGASQPGHEAIAHHDAQELLSHGYRLATASENDEFYGRSRKATSIAEDISASQKSSGEVGRRGGHKA